MTGGEQIPSKVTQQPVGMSCIKSRRVYSNPFLTEARGRASDENSSGFHHNGGVLQVAQVRGSRARTQLNRIAEYT